VRRKRLRTTSRYLDISNVRFTSQKSTSVSERAAGSLGTRSALAVLYAVDVVFMHGADIAQHLGSFGAWDGAAEQLCLLAGGVAAYACLVRNGESGAEVADAGGRGAGIASAARPSAEVVAAERRRMELLWYAAVIATGLCLVMFGLAHFLNRDLARVQFERGRVSELVVLTAEQQ
jgi:hypothetical protein